MRHTHDHVLPKWRIHPFLDSPLPLLVVICHILEASATYYNIKMLASHLENADDKHTGGQVEEVGHISIEQEIECPRCHVMTLYSEFDRLGYLCEECNFSLQMGHWKII
jgi:hypothetical protein